MDFNLCTLQISRTPERFHSEAKLKTYRRILFNIVYSLSKNLKEQIHNWNHFPQEEEN